MSEDAKTKPLMSKAALQKRIEDAHRELQRTVGAFDDEAMSKLVGEGDWTLKDVLAHIAGWEQILLKFHLGGEPFDQVIALKGAKYRVTSFDEVNAHLHRRYQALSAQETLRFLSDTHAQVMAALESFPEDQLHQPHPQLSTGASASINWADYIAANTYEHYEEHLASL